VVRLSREVVRRLIAHAYRERGVLIETLLQTGRGFLRS
jgi:hypothetical protein